MFVTSDTLANYVLIMYELSRHDSYSDELEEEIQKHTANSQLLLTVTGKAVDFEHDIMQRLQDSLSSETRFASLMKELHAQHVLDADDYSMVAIEQEVLTSNENNSCLPILM